MIMLILILDKMFIKILMIFIKRIFLKDNSIQSLQLLFLMIEQVMKNGCMEDQKPVRRTMANNVQLILVFNNYDNNHNLLILLVILEFLFIFSSKSKLIFLTLIKSFVFVS